MRQTNSQPVQNQIMNKLLSTKLKILKEKTCQMEAQFIGNLVIENTNCKNVQITCPSSNESSPNFEQKTHKYSGPRSISSLQAEKLQPKSHYTALKAISLGFVLPLKTTQRRSHSEIEGKKKKLIYKKLDNNINQSELGMDQQNQQQDSGTVSLYDQIAKSGQQPNCLIIGEANVKNQLHSQNQKDKNIKKSIQTSQIIISQFINQAKTQINAKGPTNSIKSQQVERPLPDYQDARAALYVWTRSLCFQLGLCYDVFALSIRYLDEYHITHRNAYNRSTFTENVYALIIIASKFANKQVLTPKRVAQKIGMQRQKLEGIQIKLLKMMNYEVCFQTFAKMLQRKLQKWEAICQQKQLIQQSSFFQQDLSSFNRLYSLIEQIQKYARYNLQVSQEMFLNAFVKSLGPQFSRRGQSHLLANILSQVFEETILQKPQQFTFQTILNLINNRMDIEDQSQHAQKVSTAFERRNRNQIHPSYNIFLNSIFKMQFSK